jgi:DNA mismatch repair protein MutH
LAHEISEGDTLYLGACTKSSDSTVRVAQPNSKEPAKPRAFSLKTSYLKVILQKGEGLTRLKVGTKVTDLEKFVLDNLARYRGWGEKKMIARLCAGEGAKAKNRYRMMINRMLDLPGDAKIEQFAKAGVQIKTIRVQKTGGIKESMSFRNIDFFELLKNTEWEESDFYHDVSRRFLFCIFREGLGGSGYGFDMAFFWTMPVTDLDEAHRVWLETRKRAKAKRYDQLPRSKESNVAHVRTKGRDNEDLTKTPNNGLVTKRCFWLNRKYIEMQIALSQIKINR